MFLARAQVVDSGHSVMMSWVETQIMISYRRTFINYKTQTITETEKRINLDLVSWV